MKLNRNWFLGLLVSQALLGCGAEGAPIGSNGSEEAHATGQQLSVLELDEGAGKLLVQLSDGQRTIKYDLRLGEPMLSPPSAEELALNPDLPTYQVDARVLDSNDQPIHMQMGGDAFLDASWSMPPIENFDEAGRLQDFQLMEDAEPAFRRLQLPASLEQLRFAALEIARSLHNEAPKQELELTPTGEPQLPQGLTRPLADPVLASGPSSVRKWDFVVRKKCLAGCLADHSAVFLRGWSATSIVFRAYSCNHGTCASNTTVMRDHCTMPGFRTDDGTRLRYFYTESSTTTGARYGGCTTGYKASSLRGHNCNDDSELQGRAIWHDRAQPRDSGSCNNIGTHDKAPGCSY